MVISFAPAAGMFATDNEFVEGQRKMVEDLMFSKSCVAPEALG